MTIYYLIVDENGNTTGGGISNTNTIPFGRVACTQEQSENPQNWDVINGAVVPIPHLLTNAKSVQSVALSNACATLITSGFTSSALGSAYTYASTEVDQRNIVQSAQSTKGGLLACQNATGVWARQPHTQAQAQQVLDDFVKFRDLSRENLGALQTQVAICVTLASVQAVLWQEPAGG